MLKIKVFESPLPDELEREVNAWLSQEKEIELTATHVTHGPNGICMVYEYEDHEEPPEGDEEEEE